jgi:hypothetical protein
VTSPSELHIVIAEQQDPRLGRQVVHDPRNRRFAAPRTGVARRSVAHRIYDPRPNPNQPRGNCTGCAEAMMANAKGNRHRSTVLDMFDADRIYSRATELDPWPGSWPPQDTGSSGGAAAQAAVDLGLAERYEWYFGLEHTLDGLQHHPLSVGTWWYEGLFEPDRRTKVVRPTGQKVGGHQYLLRAYDVTSKLNVGQHRLGLRCWWGGYQDAWITVDDFAGLLADDGDVHYTARAYPTG